MKKCIVFGAAPIRNIDAVRRHIVTGDMIICADGGLRHAAAVGLTPDLAVGDFDSYVGAIDAREVITLPKEKDDTDVIAALREGLSRGCREFVMFGVLGGRLDHTYANFCALSFLCDQVARGLAVDGDTRVTMIKDSAIMIPATAKYLSVFPFDGPAEGVTESGVRFPLDNAKLTGDNPLGVSNEFAGGEATITVKSGKILIITTNDAPM